MIVQPDSEIVHLTEPAFYSRHTSGPQGLLDAFNGPMSFYAVSDSERNERARSVVLGLWVDKQTSIFWCPLRRKGIDRLVRRLCCDVGETIFMGSLYYLFPGINDRVSFSRIFRPNSQKIFRLWSRLSIRHQTIP